MIAKGVIGIGCFHDVLLYDYYVLHGFKPNKGFIKDYDSIKRLRDLFSLFESDVSPITHIDVVDVLRQRMLVVRPVHTRYAVSEYVGSI